MTEIKEQTGWIKVEDRLSEKDVDMYCIIEYDDGELWANVRWRSIYDDALVDENGFVIYPPIEKRVVAWMPIPYYPNLYRKHETCTN